MKIRAETGPKNGVTKWSPFLRPYIKDNSLPLKRGTPCNTQNRDLTAHTFTQHLPCQAQPHRPPNAAQWVVTAMSLQILLFGDHQFQAPTELQKPCLRAPKHHPKKQPKTQWYGAINPKIKRLAGNNFLGTGVLAEIQRHFDMRKKAATGRVVRACAANEGPQKTKIM